MIIPEEYILTEIASLWIEKFPEGSTTNFPKGLVKRISMNPTTNKDGLVNGKYSSRISLLWYDVNTLLFDSKMATILTSINNIRTEVKVLGIAYEGRTDGYDEVTDMHVMNLDFIIKHTL